MSLEDHLRRSLDAVRTLEPLELSLLEAQDCVLAADVVSPLDLPGFDNSAMDGYAVYAGDVATASEQVPVLLPVVGDVPAGATSHSRLAPGQTVRIMTGAPLPDGAESVVPVEASDGGVREVELRAPAPLGQHVRRAGSDVRTGDVVLTAGTVLGPAQLALLAAVGRARVSVHARPRVVVLSTGSELVEPGRLPGFGQVVDSNGIMLTAAAIDAGASPYRVGLVRDEPRAFLSTLHDQLVRTLQHVSLAFHDALEQSPRGRFAIVSATAAGAPTAGGAAYASAKAAAEAWTLALADSFRRLQSGRRTDPVAQHSAAAILVVKALLTPAMRAEQPDATFAGFTTTEDLADAVAGLWAVDAAAVNGARLSLAG